MLKLKGLNCLVVLLVAVGFVLIGCSSQPTANSSSDPSDQPAIPPSSESMPAGLAKLSEQDRMVALKQGVCPVTGQPLGSMGKPPLIKVDGQEVFLCCAGCEEELRNEPEKYLADVKSK